MKTILLLITLCTVTTVLYAQDEEPDLGTEAQRQAGEELYQELCAQCHGTSGAADGPAAPFVRPAPRDFTSGIFKFRSSASGELPTTEDLKRSIREGMPYTSMPAWEGNLSERQIENLVYFIKTFNDDFAGSYGVPRVVDIPEAPAFDEANVARGREVYEANECLDCHGNQGRGDGASAPTLEDQWGFHSRPADLTKRWTFRNGQDREDIYRTFTTGLDGSPMPSYSMSEDDAWALVDYVWSLSRGAPNYGTVVVARGVAGELDVRQDTALFADAPAAYFPVVGQVVEPGRAFQPGVNGIEVKAVYNADEIAIQLVWHDMTAEREGANSLTAEAPPVGITSDTSSVDTTGAAAGPPVGGVPGVSDAVAIQLPATTTEGVEKPYFLLGDADHPVDLWFADLAADGAEHFVGRGFQDVQPDSSELDVYAEYHEGAWTVVFKHPRTVEDGRSFEPEQFVPIAFSVWDGFNGERGNKRGITSWYHLYLEPMERPSALWPMLKWGLLTLVVELGLIFSIRRRYRKEAVGV